MNGSPLETHVLFWIGPIPISETVAVTWVLMALIGLSASLLARGLKVRPSKVQAAVELVDAAICDQVHSTVPNGPKGMAPFAGGVFLFILASNWSTLIPGVEPPTAHFETDIALGLVVFFAAIWFGVRSRGLLGYLKSFAEPTILMFPLNVIEAFTRTFSLVVRLFGNIMSGVFIIGVVLSIAGLLVPIPLLALELLTGAIQAYIFSILAVVMIGGSLKEDSSSNRPISEAQ